MRLITLLCGLLVARARRRHAGAHLRGRQGAYDAARGWMQHALDTGKPLPGMVSSIQTFGSFGKWHPQSPAQGRVPDHPTERRPPEGT